MDGIHVQQLFEGDHIVAYLEYADRERPNVTYEAFELVDKVNKTFVFLTGAAAAAFQDRINYWRINTPSEEEVECTIDAFMSLGQISLFIH